MPDALMTPAGWVVQCVALGVLMFACGELGLWWARRKNRREGEHAHVGVGGVEAAVFALLGLLIAFTFAGASARVEQRRQVLIDEANAVSTAYLRLDLIPEPSRSRVRQLMRDYVRARVLAYRRVDTADATTIDVARTSQMQGEIWRDTVAACHASTEPACAEVVLPALNEMFVVETKRSMQAFMHPPPVIYLLLYVLGMACAFVAGVAVARRSRPNHGYLVGFAVLIPLTVYVILDIEYPRRGVLRLDAHDRVLENATGGRAVQA